MNSSGIVASGQWLVASKNENNEDSRGVVARGQWLVASTNENHEDHEDSVRHGVPDLPISHQRLATNHYSSSTSHQPLATSHCRSLRDRRGFTLIELLITVSIIAIMASMLLFALFRGRRCRVFIKPAP